MSKYDDGGNIYAFELSGNGSGGAVVVTQQWHGKRIFGNAVSDPATAGVNKNWWLRFLGIRQEAGGNATQFDFKVVHRNYDLSSVDTAAEFNAIPQDYTVIRGSSILATASATDFSLESVVDPERFCQASLALLLLVTAAGGAFTMKGYLGGRG